VDRILIRDLAARCILGTTDDERREKQEVRINLALSLDLRSSAARDALDGALDYRAVKKRVLHAVEESRHVLLEALAEQIAGICLDDDRVRSVEVTVDKPGALRFARSVAVEINRGKGS
jgi:FolB domain-containing protein